MQDSSREPGAFWYAGSLKRASEANHDLNRSLFADALGVRDRGCAPRKRRRPLRRDPAMTLTISGWPDGDPIPVKFTQAGEQVSPEMKWTNVPKGTVTFLLHMHDPDVARNKTTDTIRCIG